MKTKVQENIVDQNIVRIRQERNLTQEEMALMSGLSQRKARRTVDITLREHVIIS